MGIEKYAVVGAGNMGSGIAQKIATEGYPVVLLDLDQPKVDAGLERIKKTLAEGVARKIFPVKVAAAIEGRVTGSADWGALADADLVVEAVFEDLEVKRTVFRRLGEIAPKAILGTNTSSFFVRDLASVTPDPSRVVGLHYFYHPAKNRLVEVIGHEGTSPAALRAAWSAQEAIGKTPIASADRPGFVVNRFFVPWLNEAVRLLESGVAGIATIDAAAKQAFGIGMGPFELMNVTGVPIALHAATTLGRELGPFYEPAPALAAQVASKRDWDLAGEAAEAAFPAVADRLTGVVFLVAAELVGEGVGSVEDTDIGARVGLRWSRGPFQMMNELGVPEAARRAAEVAGSWSRPLPALLAHPPGAAIPIKLVSRQPRGRVDVVTIQRPDAMNALNGEVVAQLAEAVDARAPGRPLIIAGSGKAFVAGADIKFFVDSLERGDVGAIQRFTAAGQELLARLSGGNAPVVARVHGLSLGGGSELALACDRIVASPKGSFGFPETGLGIYPGLGGIPRLARRIGTPLAKYFVYTGAPIDAATALEIGLADAVVPFDAIDAACDRAAAGDTVQGAARDAEAWRPVREFFERHGVAAILAGDADAAAGDAAADPRLAVAVKRMKQKSAHALLLSERLFDEGAELPLPDALALDLSRLHDVFTHPDAMEGLSALLQGRRPTFRPA